MVDKSKWKSAAEGIKVIIECFAYLFAGIFFLYHFITAASWVTLSTSIKTQRVHDSENPTQDLLAVTINLKSGVNGSVKIHDAVALVSFGKTSITNRFDGLIRMDYEEARLKPANRRSDDPYVGLGPDQENAFTTLFRVPRDALCHISVAVLARRPLNVDEVQSNASEISLPIEASRENRLQ